ncbi:MAG: hypothetical protein ACR2GT_10255 [Gaiellaceae bacterium]
MEPGFPRYARRLRIAAVALILAWFFSPRLQSWIPLWLPFLGFAALEAHFLVAGLRERGAGPGSRGSNARGRSPQAADVAELGGEEWLEPVVVRIEGQDVWLPATGKSAEEVAELIDESRERLRRGEPAEVPEEPRTAPRRRRGLLARLEGLAVLGVLGFGLLVLVPNGGWDGLDRSDRERTEMRLASEARRIAGHEARIHCDAEGEAVGIVQHADGLAEVGGSNAFLTPAICYRLHRLAFEDDEGSFSQTARALAVLAHEAWHLQGEADEGIANCYAFQSGVELGQRLGLSQETAARMMRQQLADNATFARSAPEYLVPSECRNGGSLDLFPDRSRFP